MDYSSYYYTTSSTADAAAISAALTSYSYIILIVYVLLLVGMWKLFVKAGEKGWKCLIPIYNVVTIFKICGLSPWLILVYLLGAIPVVGGLISLGLTIYQAYCLSRSFGKGAGFTVGLILLSPIFYMILGFGSAEYTGPYAQTKNNTPSANA